MDSSCAFVVPPDVSMVLSWCLHGTVLPWWFRSGFGNTQIVRISNVRIFVSL